jgi:hypothetical protein
VIASARERLRQAEGNRPPEGWGHLDGVELVVRGTKGRRVQIARARAGQWTAASEDRFLQVFAATCNAKAAYLAAGKSKGSAYTHRKRWPAFARRWEEAEGMAAIRLEWALIRHAGNPFSSIGLPPPLPVPPMSADEIMHNLSMHQYRTHGLGKAPGRASTPDFEKACRGIGRAIDAIERAAMLGEAGKEAERRSWDRRRRLRESSAPLEAASASGPGGPGRPGAPRGRQPSY